MLPHHPIKIFAEKRTHKLKSEIINRNLRFNFINLYIFFFWIVYILSKKISWIVYIFGSKSNDILYKIEDIVRVIFMGGFSF